jgi:type I restriction enzyme S subunit
MSWEEVELGSLCEIGRGSSPRPINNQAYFEGGNIPWIKIADATKSTRYIYETKQYVNSYGASFSRLLPKDSLIIAASGTLGFPMFLGVEGCIHDGWMYFKDYNGIEKEYLYYQLISLGNYFNSQSYGAAIQNINTGILRDTKIELPDIKTQKRIADILSAYDDLIENNQKRIKLLEQAAQNIYKEWFVHLRFPGCENTPINKETGLPMEWRYGFVSDFGKVVTGKTPPTKRKDFYGVDVPFIKTPDMHKNIYMDNVEQYISNKGADSQKNKYLPKNTVIVSCIGARAGVVAITSKASQTNQQINALISKDINANFWFYFFFKGFKDELRALGSSGATMTNVSKGKFEGIKLIYPSENSLKEFNKIASICFDKILNLQKQNQKLHAARDILLPRLMNRTIEV